MFDVPGSASSLALAALLFVLGVGCGHAVGQQTNFVRSVPRTDTAPTIDGTMSPGEWKGAVLIENFKQVDPEEGAEPSERTVVHLLADADMLYIGFECNDSDPTGISATLRTRDVRLDPDDRVEFVLDTFLDRRNAYFFQLGAGGSKGDGLIGTNFFTKDYDGIWEGKVTIHDKGWTGEVAIPAKTVSMSGTHASFGFNVLRIIKRKNERIQWSSPRRNTRLFNVGVAGTLQGMEVLDQGIGLDIKPFLSAKGRREWDRDVYGGDIDPGLDVVYKITPSLSATLTVNTDFAETEVDDRIVNLTRFAVFFPEKRDFFLEDAGIFSFGTGRRGGFLPFFSRRIGLSADGDPVPILVGGKLTGRIGDLNLGVLDVVQDSVDDVDMKNLAVVRASLNILEQSSVGVLMTLGDPRTNGENALGGIDFAYRIDDFLGDKSLRIDAFALGTFDDPDSVEKLADGIERELGYAYGLRFDYPNDIWDLQLRYREVSEFYRPDLGFVTRRGTRSLRGDFQYRPRPGGAIRRYEFIVEPNVVWRIDGGEVETAEAEIVPFSVELETEDKFGVSVVPTYERLIDPFEIEDGIIIPVGDYDFYRFGVFAEFSDVRPVSGEIKLTSGSFFTGWRHEFEVEATWRPNPTFRLTTGAEHNIIELDEGDFSTTLVSFRVVFDFSPDLSWSILAQWDDVSDTLGINSRIRWIVAPGNEVFFVVNQGFATALDEGDDRFRFRALTTELAAKVAWTFRF
ncbi:MAG: hypothetical protein CMJ83_18365 [Planctomycetes bacterium]|nr:hypothetical protein [Planctomycetota bacterium]